MAKLRGSMAINEKGHLEIGGCDAVELARSFGTPLYVLDETFIRSQCRAYREGFAKAYHDAEVIYAGKALLTMAICRLIAQEGLSLDVVSGGELYTALKADFPAERIFFHGNNKSRDELAMAMDANIHRFVVDNFYEMALLEELAKERGRRVPILLRITPGIEAHTHSYIQTGQEDSKFGFGLAGSVALEAARRSLGSTHLELVGFHCHIGSQIFDLSSFEAAGRAVFSFLDALRSETGYVARELNLGGGLGIRYTDGDVSMDPREYSYRLGSFVQSECAARHYPRPRLLVEPGRSIVGEAGTTLYTIGSSKQIPGLRTYIAVDGGMADNPRVALYQAKYEAMIANRAGEHLRETVTVAGKCCESGDMLLWDVELPAWNPGDILAIFATGAYNYSMASNYNRLPRPAMVLVQEGVADLIVERETYEDLVRHDRIPARFEQSTSA